MIKTTTHNRLFGLVYKGQPNLPNIQGCIDVGMPRISASCAFKGFAISRTDYKTGVTHLRRIGWIDNNNRNAASLRLVFDKRTKLAEIPPAEARPELFSLIVPISADTFQVFKDNTSIAVFSCLNDMLCNGVVHDRSRSSFLSRKPFQGFFTAFRAFGLKRRSNLLAFCSIVFNRFPGHYFTGGKRCYVHDAKIDTDKIFNIFNIIFGYFYGLKKIKLTFFINKIGLALNIGQKLGIVANKRNPESSVNRPNRYCLPFVRKNAFIIGNGSKWFKRPFVFFVNFITVNSLGNTPDNHLSRKIKNSPDISVDKPVKFILIKNFIIPSNFGNIITRSIGFTKRIQKQIDLGRIWQKFYLKCQFHIIIIIKYLRMSSKNFPDYKSGVSASLLIKERQ